MKLTPVFFKILRRSLGCVLAILLLPGCYDPEGVVEWSPDGQWGLVRDGKQSALIDVSGNVIGQFAPPGETKSEWHVESWMPDSSRALAVNAVETQNWSELEPLLGAERAAGVKRGAETLLGWMRSYQGDWKAFGNDDPRIRDWIKTLDFYAGYSFRSERYSPSEQTYAVFAYLREKYPVESASMLEATEAGQQKRSGPFFYRLVLRAVRPGANAEEKPLYRSADPLSAVCPSPDGKLIAFVRSEPVRPALYIVPADGSGTAVRIDEGMTQAAWTPDGRSLVYQKTSVPYEMVEEKAQLGTLTIRRVLDANNAILAELPPAEDILGTLFSKVLDRVACLPDGRILFVSWQISLPAVEAAESMSLFTVSPADPQTLKCVIREADRKAIPHRCDRFALSPDGRYVAMPGPDGEVSLLSLETGEVTLLQKAIAGYRKTDDYVNSPNSPAPTWRGGNELCYVIPEGDPAGSPQRVEVVLQRLGETRRVISKGWSDEMTAHFLPRRKAP